MEAERKTPLGKMVREGHRDVQKLGEHWAIRFLRMAAQSLRKGDASRFFDNITIINFNYDRALDQYLYWSLQDTYGFSAEEALNAIYRLSQKTIRPYGSLGPLDWQQQGGTRYGSTEDLPSRLFDIASQIRTYTEQLDDSDMLDFVRYALSQARLVVVLGFGFHPQNMRLFEQGGTRGNVEARRVFATMFKTPDENHELWQNQLQAYLKTNAPVRCSLKEAHQMLQDLEPSIMAFAGSD